MASDSLRPLAIALRQAVFDKQCEVALQAVPRFYFDADILTPIFLGIEYGEFAPSAVPDQLALFRALFTWGAIVPRCFIVAPHAKELLEELEESGKATATRLGSDYRNRIKAYLRAEGLNGHLRSLQDRLNTNGRSRTSANMAPILAGIAPKVLIAIERVRMPWRRRLRTLWNKTVFLEESEVAMEEVIDTDECRVFMQSLQHARTDADINNLQDAAALSYMHQRIEAGQGKAGGTDELVRYCTATRMVAQVCRDVPEVVELLKNPTGIRVGKSLPNADELTIVREPLYFIVRLLFPAVAIGGGRPTATRNADLDLNDLEQLSGQLQTYVDNPIGKAKDIWSTTVRGRPVREILQAFEDLVIAQDVIDNYEIANIELPDVVDETRKLWEFARGKISTKRYFSDDIDQAWQELSEKLSTFRSWAEVYRRVYAGARKRAAAMARSGQHQAFQTTPDAMRDLGLVRWGLALTPDRQQQLDVVLRKLMSYKHDELWEPCGQIVKLVRNADKPEDCVLAAAVLWHLGLLADLVALVETASGEGRWRGARAAGRQILHLLALMGDAARIRDAASQELSPLDKDKIIRNLVSTARRIKGKQRVAFMLGLGYVSFHAWLSEVDREDVLTQDRPGTSDPTLVAWAQCSWNAGKDALEELIQLRRRSSVEWSFAINHCVFVGAVTGVAPEEEVEKYWKELTGLRLNQAVWHYRFADTDAYVSFLRASRLWTKVTGAGNAVGSQEGREAVIRELGNARRALEGATPSFGDEEIEAHWRDIERLEDDVRRQLAFNPWSKRTGAPGVGI